MSFRRFIEETAVGAAALRHVIVSTRGYAIRDLKLQVQGQVKKTKLIRNRGLGRRSDYERIFDEIVVTPIASISHWMPADDPLAAAHLTAWRRGRSASPAAYASTTDLERSVRAGHDLEGFLIENQYYGAIWIPEFTTGEKVVIGTVMFVKLAAAVAGTVLTFGAAAPALVGEVASIFSNISDIVGTVQQIKSTASAAMELADKVIDVGSQAGELYGMLSGPDRPGAALTMFQSAGLASGSDHISADGVSLGTHAAGVDIALPVFSHSEAARRMAADDRQRLARMFFLCAQQITPVRSVVSGDPRIIYGGRYNLTPTEYSYNMAFQAAGRSIVRVGQSTREAVATAVLAARVEDARYFVYPWDNRGMFEWDPVASTGSVSRSVDAYFHQALRDNSRSAALAWDGTSGRLPALDWESAGWVDWVTDRQRIIPFPRLDDMSPFRRPIIEAARRNLRTKVRVIGALSLAAKEAASRRHAAAEQMARSRYADARRQRQRLAAAANSPSVMRRAQFEADTYRFAGRRSVLLCAADDLLGVYEGCVATDYDKRLELLAGLRATLRRYLEAKPRTTKRTIVETLLGQVDRDESGIAAYVNFWTLGPGAGIENPDG